MGSRSNYLWVLLDPSEKKEKENSVATKAHAARQAHRVKRIAETIRAEQSRVLGSVNTSFTLPPQMSSVHCQFNGLNETSTKLDGQAYNMLKDYFTVWIPSLSPEQSSTTTLHAQKLFQSVLTDPLILAVTLAATYARAAFVSADNDMSQSNDANILHLRRYWRHKDTVLRLVQARCNAGQYENHSLESLWWAMGGLAGCGFQTNEPHEGRIHIQAWIRLARHNFCTLSILHFELLFLNEMRFSCLLGEPPLCPAPEVEPIVRKVLPKLPLSFGIVPSHFEELLDSHNAHGLTGIILNLYEATELINHRSCFGIEKHLHDTLLLRVLFAGFSLCLHAGETNRMAANPCFYEAVRLTALLVINTTHFKASPRNHLFDRLVTDLQLQLHYPDFDLNLCWNKYPAAMLWICFMGTYSSLGKRMHWFLENIQRGMRLLDMKSWAQGRELLKLFPYIDAEFDRPFKEIWELATVGYRL